MTSSTPAVFPKFIDDPNGVVDAAVDGLCMANPTCQRIANTNVVVSSVVDPTKVLLLCGGGSGHEPAHAGFVGQGWLSAAVCGSVFASPPTSHVSAGIEYLAKQQGPDGPGILVIIKNYAGDVLNFEFAVRQAQAHGIRVESVLAADDAVFGVGDLSRRRGLAGTCLLYKILGVAAARGQSLAQLKALAERITRRTRSIGASLSSCSLPGCPPSSVLPAGVVEVGLGIHGEKGLVQEPFRGAAALSAQLIDTLIKPPDTTDPLPTSMKCLLLVNNLGATTELEMSILTKHALLRLAAAGYTVIGVHVGRHMTSLEMHGFSLTLLAVEDEGDVDYMLHTVDVQKGLMNFHAPQMDPRQQPGPLTALQLALQQRGSSGSPPEQQHSSGGLAESLRILFEKLVTMESHFNALDAEVGDGDLGSGVHRAATTVLELLPFLPWDSVARSFALLGKAVADSCAGTSGPLYGVLLIGGGLAAGAVLEDSGLSGEAAVVTAIRAAIAAGSDDVQKLGGARRGDRTMVDVLEALRHSPAVQEAVTVAALLTACRTVARQAADETAMLPAKFGRSRYMGGKEVSKKDPGAELIAYWLEVLSS